MSKKTSTGVPFSASIAMSLVCPAFSTASFLFSGLSARHPCTQIKSNGKHQGTNS
jgi:hypothetical protein